METDLKLKRAERKNKYNQQKREKENSILEKAMDLLSQNKEMSLEENNLVRKAEEIKAKRLKISEYRQKWKASATPEAIESMRLRKLEHNRQYRQRQKAVATPEAIEAKRLRKLEENRQYRQKRKAIATPEEKKLMRSKKLEYARKYREKKRGKEKSIPKKSRQYRQKREVDATPEEKEEMRLKKLENSRKYKEQKRDKEDSILHEAKELISKNRELSLEENDIVRKAEEIKTQRLKKSEDLKLYFHNRKAAAPPEEVEATKLKNMEQVRQCYQEKREKIRQYRQRKREKQKSILKKAMDLPIQNEEMSLEEKGILRKAKDIEAMTLIRLERARFLRKIKREKENSILEKAMELLSQNQELSLEENDIVRKAEEIKVKRSKTRQYSKQYFLNHKAAATSEEGAALRLKRVEHRQAIREKEDSILKQATELLRQNQEMSLDEREVLRLAEKIKTDRLRKSEYFKHYRMRKAFGRLRTDQVYDEIKIEKEVLQETTIKAIPARQNSNSVLDMQQEGYNDSSCSWLELSEKSIMTGETSKNHSYFQSFHGGSSSIQESFASHSTKFDQRMLSLENSFRCMKVLIDATAKREGHAIFGKQIAQKLRSSKKNVAEVNIAKQLIDDILQNLAIGVYSFETKIV